MDFYQRRYVLKLRLLNRIIARPPMRALTHKYFHEKLDHYDARFFESPVESTARHRILIEMLRNFSSLCTSVKVNPILMHGGLLGWYWNEHLLPWDDDIDICLFYFDLLRLAQVNRYDFYDRSAYLLDINPNHFQRHSKNVSYYHNEEENRIDARFIDTATGMYIDITALSESSLGYYTKCPHLYKRRHLKPLRLAKLEGIDVYVPNNAKAVLIQEYGKRSIEQTTYRQYWFDQEARLWRIHCSCSVTDVDEH